MTIFAITLLAYLLGSIPFGLLLTRAAGLGDIRSIGSGNIGATNVLRTGNKKIAAATLLLDGFKGAAAVLIAAHFYPGCESVAALAALLGHIFPVWLRFKGGKGVATGIGVMLGLLWPAGLVMLAMWAGMAKRFHISSLSALVAFGFLPVDVIIFGRADLALFALAIAAIIFFTHRANIRRLFLHTEPKIGHTHEPAAPTHGQ
ncbi:MAG: glycerol-3-phosphate 1-O-acyltransferase PlsY [Alphaproteobacteria bacterium]|nr:glycerol-3-phosphate 1-O-acyltransferase PlsY [Alphaproteobacteria bacterium]